MSRRARILVLCIVGAVVVAAAGGYAVLALTGDDAPPPPKLSGAPTGGGGSGALRPSQDDSYVGYRVNEEYLGIGVRTAVGRTSSVAGTVTVAGDEVRAADLRVDMRALRSDQSRRDGALRVRGIETDRYPSSRFTLAGPFAIAAGGVQAKGTLDLHGRRAPIVAMVRGQRLAGGRVELVGSAPIRFADFAIEPPSVAGIVTVRDHGVLEFKLVLAAGA
jgi:polyisoprenoid-binding protein YceI